MEETEIKKIELLMNGEEVKLKNPGTKALKDYLILAKVFSKLPKDDKDANFLEYLDEKAMDSVENIINITLEKTFGEVTEEIDEWAMQNSMVLLPKIIEMCSPKNVNIEEKKKEEHLKKLNQISE